MERWILQNRQQLFGFEEWNSAGNGGNVEDVAALRYGDFIVDDVAMREAIEHFKRRCRLFKPVRTRLAA